MTHTTLDLAHADLTLTALLERLHDAQEFHTHFHEVVLCDAAGLRIAHMGPEVEKFIRRNASIPHAVLAKLGANTIAKRRPQETQGFLDYLTRCHEARATLVVRLVFGPVKNVRRFGAYQAADMAEYLTLIQLARVVQAIAAIYPHGVRVQLVPDDKRGGEANAWPAAYSSVYIANLKRLVKDLAFDPWLDVEDGQARLYAHYRVQSFKPQAIIDVMADEEFTHRMEQARHHARENLFSDGNAEVTEHAVQDSAMRYLVALRAEMLSGMWSPVDALPLMYANHAGNYQLYTLGRGLTKLPWQIRLPFVMEHGRMCWTSPETEQPSDHLFGAVNMLAQNNRIQNA